MTLNLRKKHKLRTEINIVNLIDIMFVINIFLLITTSFSATTNAIDVTLPQTTQAKTLKTQEENNVIDVRIDRMERMYVNNNKITPERLREIFTEKKLLSQKINLVLTADALCSHGKIVEVLDMAKKYGINNLNIATQNTVTGEKNDRKQRAMAN